MSKSEPIFGAIVCSNCGTFTMGYKEDYEDDPDFFEVNCDCVSTNTFIPASKMADPDFFIRAIEDGTGKRKSSFVCGFAREFIQQINKRCWIEI